jgi:hypothetical protein
MAATKTCPSCGAEAPSSAVRCKECFHDFAATKSGPNHKAGILLILGTITFMTLSGAGVFYWQSQLPLEHKILVDESTRSVIFTTQYRSGPVTERLKWDDVARLEHVLLRGGAAEVVAVRLDGERRTIQEGTSSLAQVADHYSRLMEKPLTTVDNTSGFMKPDQ